MKTIQLFVLGFVSWIQIGYSQIPPDLIGLLDSIVYNAIPAGNANTGVVVGVCAPGQWSWTTASGYSISGLTNGYPSELAKPDSKFRIGSISKMFIATSIMQLEEAGLLNISDDISLYLRPSLLYDTIHYNTLVTIRNLLDHTSGFADLATNDSCRSAAFTDLTRNFTLEEAIYCGCIQGKLFPPNFSWSYSNTNYSILSMIIEEVTGLSSYEYITSNIIIPLGLFNTEVPSTDQIVSPHMGCYWDLPPLLDLTVVDASLYQGWADIVSTTEDLFLFYDALRKGDLVNNTSFDKMMTVSPSSYDYGLAIDFYKIDGDDYYGHSGEVGNTSGMFFADISTSFLPNGYYLTYNYNYQGINSSVILEQPIHELLKSYIEDSSSQDTILLHSLNDIYNHDFVLFPNPSYGKCYALVNLPTSTRVEVDILDITGRNVVQFISTVNSGKLIIPDLDLENGTYHIRLTSIHGRGIKSLVITDL